MEKIESEIRTPFAKLEVAKNLKLILQSAAYCTLCFDTKEELLHLDHSVAIKELERGTLPFTEVLGTIFGNAQDLLTSNYICKPCKTSAYNSFAFICKTKKTARIYTKYVNQIDKVTSKLSASLNSKVKRTVIVLDSYENVEEPNAIEPEPIEPDPIEPNPNSLNNCGHSSPTLSEPHSPGPNPIEPKLIEPNPIETSPISILRHMLMTEGHDYCGYSSPTLSKPHGLGPKPTEPNPVESNPTGSNPISLHLMLKTEGRDDCGLSSPTLSRVHRLRRKPIEPNPIETKTTSLRRMLKTEGRDDCGHSSPTSSKVHSLRRKPIETNTTSLRHMLKTEERDDYGHSSPTLSKVHGLEPNPIEDETKKYTCDGCGKDYIRKSYLIKHLKKNGIGCSKRLSCPHCNIRPCIHEEYIQAYNQQEQSKIVPMSCTCGYRFGRTLAQLIAHVNMDHLDIRTNICEVCGKSFYLEKHYKKHFYKQHQHKLVCELCSRKCRSKKHLETHMRTCSGTTKRFKRNKSRVRSETKLIHQFHDYIDFPKPRIKYTGRRRKIYKCLMCDKVLKTKMELRSHINKMHEKKPNSCLYCNKQYETRQEYLDHIQSEEHKNNRNVPYGFKHRCSDCDYSTNTLEMLEAHINKIHLSIRPFECEHCHKNYFDSKQLRLHMKIHTGERKPQVCDICGAHLSCTSTLKKHRRLHTGENPYACPYCDVKTICSSTLKVHIMQKHMEPSIQCPLCDRKFHTMKYARRHVKKIHWKRNETFDYTKLKGLAPEDYDFFRDKRNALV